MAPGTELFPYLLACNEAKCAPPQLLGSVVIVAPNTQTAVCRDGQPLQLGLTLSSRARREIPDSLGQPDNRKARSASNISVETPTGRLSLFVSGLLHPLRLVGL